MAMRQICHAGQMLLELTDTLARKEGAFGQASLPNSTVITLLQVFAISMANTFFFVLLVGIHFVIIGFSLGGLPGYDTSYPYHSCSNFSSIGHCNRGRFLSLFGLLLFPFALFFVDYLLFMLIPLCI